MTRSRPRRAALALLAAVLATPLLPAVQAQAAITVTKVPLAFTVTVGPSNRACTVLGDLYLPSSATSATPAAAILSTNGFGGSKDDGGERGSATVAMHYAKRGYVGLSYSGLGFGGSDCEVYLDQRAYDGAAGDQLAQFLGGRKGLATRTDTKTPYDIGGRVRTQSKGKAFDPVVGMIGVSYGGSAQYAVASFGRIDTIIPQITWNDLSYALAPNNTSQQRGAGSPRSVTYATPGVTKIGWTALFFTLGLAQDVTNDKPQDAVNGLLADPSGACPNFDPRACPAIVDLATDGTPDPTTLAFARNASVASYLDQIRIPVLLSQGQSDTLFDLQEAIATYSALKARGNDVKMVWQSWGHSAGTPRPGELDLRLPASATYEGAMYAAWFDHYLLGKGPKPSLATEYYRDWLDDGSGLTAITRAYASSPSYPVAPTTTMYLSGTHALVPDRAAVTAGDSAFVAAPVGLPTSYSEIPQVLQDAPPTDAPGTFAQFTTAPLARPMDLAGVPALTVTLTAPTYGLAGAVTQLAVFVKLYDLAPDGTITLQHKLVAAQRVATLGKPVRLELPGVVQRIPAGHRLSVVVAASDSGYRGNTLPGLATLTTTPASPGRLELPIVSGTAFGTTVLATPTPTTKAGPTSDAAPSAPVRPAGGSLAATGASRVLPVIGLITLAGAALLIRRNRRGD